MNKIEYENSVWVNNNCNLEDFSIIKLWIFLFKLFHKWAIIIIIIIIWLCCTFLIIFHIVIQNIIRYGHK
jgi:hypothetical protein